MKLLTILFSLFIFTGCAGLLGTGPISQTQSGLGGAIGGAAAVKVVEKVKEVFTPKYPLYLQPIELCVLGAEVTCSLAPCTEDCDIKMSFSEFVAWQKELQGTENPKVATLRTSAKQINTMQEYCRKNDEAEKACIDQISQYEGQTIVVEVVDD